MDAKKGRCIAYLPDWLGKNKQTCTKKGKAKEDKRGKNKTKERENEECN